MDKELLKLLTVYFVICFVVLAPLRGIEIALGLGLSFTVFTGLLAWVIGRDS